MKIILSPAKTMYIADTPGLPNRPLSEPIFALEASMLNVQLAKMDVFQLKQLFKISDDLAAKVHAQILGFASAPADAAIFAFRGEVFKKLSPSNLDAAALGFADSHLRIFSGLYGILQAFDAVKNYRLDFNTSLKVAGKFSLKQFWQSKIVDYFSECIADGEVILNLASTEYSTVLAKSALKSQLITLQFRENKNDTLKNVSVFSKQARGLFCRAILQNKIEDVETLKNIEVADYKFRADLSIENEWFFVR